MGQYIGNNFANAMANLPVLQNFFYVEIETLARHLNSPTLSILFLVDLLHGQ